LSSASGLQWSTEDERGPSSQRRRNCARRAWPALTSARSRTKARHEHGTTHGREDPRQVFARRLLQLLKETLEMEEGIRLLVPVRRAPPGGDQCLRERLEPEPPEAQPEQELMSLPRHPVR